MYKDLQLNLDNVDVRDKEKKGSNYIVNSILTNFAWTFEFKAGGLTCNSSCFWPTRLQFFFLPNQDVLLVHI